MSKLSVKKHDPVAKPEPPTVSRPSTRLLGYYLDRSLHRGGLGPEPRAMLEGASVDLYDRLRVRDPVDSMQAATIIALFNTAMDGLAEAGGRKQVSDEKRDLAVQRVAVLFDRIRDFEARRSVKQRDDPAFRASIVEAVLDHLDRKEKS